MSDTFEYYLYERFCDAEPEKVVLTNNDPGPFDDWLMEQEQYEIAEWAQKWHDEEMEKAKAVVK